jgi:hypothetical protein
MPHDSSKQKPLTVEAHAYTPDCEPEVLAILHVAFGPAWGDQAFWRWKHLQRPGFCEHDVRVYRSAGTVIGCWHMAERRLRLGSGLDIAASVEGDYAMHPEWRGVGMGRDPASLKEVRLLAERGIVARFAFTSPALFERIYRPKLGYRRIRTVTARYRKLISDTAIRERLQRAGERLSSQGFMRKLVRQRPLSIAIEVSGFRRCLLIMDAQGARCTWEYEVDPDLAVGVPYALINTRTVAAAARVASLALLGGKLRIRYATRFVRRVVSGLLS